MKKWIALTGVVFLSTMAVYAEGPSTPVNPVNPVIPILPKVNDPNIFINLAKKAIPYVVNIATLAVPNSANGGSDESFRQFWEFFFQGPGMPNGPKRFPKAPKSQPPAKPQPLSMGSGFIIEDSGLILTNNHVVADADEIHIIFTEEDGEKPTKGEVVGRDPDLDLALIRVKTSRKLQAAELGDSDALEVGEYVMAVGNPFGQGHTVTHGIISAKGRNAPDFPLARYLQTDAPINPGNSGGPLVNLKGEVIGINNAIDARAQGIGFAIPMNLVKRVLPQLKTKGMVSRGYIGVLVNDLTPEIAEKMRLPKTLEAPFAAHVFPEGPADKAGVQPYDVILEFNGKKIHKPADLINEVTSVEVGRTLPLKVNRGGKELSLKIKVGERPNSNDLGRNEDGVPVKPKKGSKQEIPTGMDLQNLTPQIAKEMGLPASSKGVLVESLEYDGPAARAGLVRGDVILEVDQSAVTTAGEFFAIVKEKKSYLLRVERLGPSGQPIYLVVVLDLK